MLVQSLASTKREGVAQLIELLDSKQPVVQIDAAKALLRVDPAAAKAAIPKLKELMHDENPAVRNAASQVCRFLEKRPDGSKKTEGQVLPRIALAPRTARLMSWGPPSNNADQFDRTSEAPKPSDAVENSDPDTMPIQAVLTHLTKAVGYARDVQCDPWEFAVELERLLELGATTSQLRWMVKKGLIEHVCEVTEPEDPARRFRHPQNLAFSEKSCFCLGKAGMSQAAERGATASAALQALSGVPAPQWDAEDRTLYIGDLVVKEYRVRSPNQEAVLSAFQEEGWPHYIDDPLSPAGEQSPKQRLRDTIKCLNANQKHHLIRFRGDGTGERVRWELIADRPLLDSEIL